MTRSAEPLLTALCVGLLSGTHAAIWGMYKDALHEGFSLARFMRSIVVGALAAIVIQGMIALPLPDPRALLVLFGLAYAAERGLVEVWKTFVRDEDQSKYFIPMQFSVHGVPVRSRLARLVAGSAYVTLVVTGLAMVARLDPSPARGGSALVAAALGLGVGLVIAFGGAWKDAPSEGFDRLKFLRSPAVTLCAALFLSTLTTSWLEIAVGAIGYERATVETYKKFFFPTTAPGKFAGKPVLHPAMMRHRRWFVPAFVGIWLVVALSGAAAFGRSSDMVMQRSTVAQAGS